MLTGVAGLLALSVRAAAAEGPSAARQVPAPAGIVRVINEYLAAKSAHSPDQTMSFFDRGNTASRRRSSSPRTQCSRI
jgi:hypothetical protein